MSTEVPLPEEALALEPETGTGALRLDLTRRVVAEAVGTGFLVMAVIGSGIMAQRLSPDDVGLQLLENAFATAGALVGLILMFGAVSGAHFNPVVTLTDRWFGTIRTRDAALYIGAQVVGGCIGAMLANLMFELPAIDVSTKTRSSGALWLSEAIATVGLLLVIHGCVRTGRALRSGRVDRRRLLVHLVDELRQPRGDHRPNPFEHLCRHRPVVGADVRGDAARRHGRRDRGDLAVLPPPRGGSMSATRPEVLFVCVHNAGRSQMAAAFLQHYGGDRVVVRSAGSAPADDVNPAVVEAMAEVGIDLRAMGARPKRLDEAAVQASDVVVTMGCGDACPIYPGKRYEDWKLDDPAGQGVDAVRPIRDEIDRRIRGLLAEIAPVSA